MNEMTFVGRDSQLEQLFNLHEKSKNDKFQTCFVTGNTGTGKTSLIKKFSQEIVTRSPKTHIIKCQCEANLGKNSPYAPFIDFLIQISKIDGINKIEDISNTIIDFNEKFTSITEKEVFLKLTDIFKSLALEEKIVLILEDIHWIDEPSLKLLQHLFKELESKNIFILGSYRLNEINLLSKKHPLSLMREYVLSKDNVNEVNLHEITTIERKKFIRQILDIEPNILNNKFTETILQHTNAEPLFTLELLEHLKNSGHITKNRDQKYYIIKPIEWDTLPKLVEEIIEERIEKLPANFREILNVASVEGGYFTLQVVANILNIPQNIIIKELKIDLGERYHFIQSNGTKELDDYTLYLFSFLHTIFQNYLYAKLNENEKKVLHTKIADQLELLYYNNTQIYLYKLAYHYRLSNDNQKAIEYLIKAGKYALKLNAYKESLTQFDYALEILNSMPTSQSNKRLQFDIQILRATVLKATTGWVSKETILAYEEALKLGRTLKLYNDLAPVLFGLWTLKLMTLALNDAIELAQECLQIGKAINSDVIQVQAHIASSNTYFWIGNFKESSKHANLAINLYQPSHHDEHILNFGYNPLSLGYMFDILSMSAMGKEEDAITRRDEIMEIAKTWSHPFSLAICYQADAWMNYHLNNPEGVQEASQILLELSKRHNFPFYIGIALILGGWANTKLGEKGNHTQNIKNGFKKYIKNSGAMIAHSLYRLILSQVYFDKKDNNLALQNINKALNIAYKNSELCYEAELLIMKAKTSSKKERKEIISQAITTAKQQNSKLFEKRANRVTKSTK